MQERRKRFLEDDDFSFNLSHDSDSEYYLDPDSDLDSDSEVKTSVGNIPDKDGDISNGSSFMASDGDETDLLVLVVQSGTAVGASIKKQGTYPSVSWVLAKMHPWLPVILFWLITLTNMF